MWRPYFVRRRDCLVRHAGRFAGQLQAACPQGADEGRVLGQAMVLSDEGRRGRRASPCWGLALVDDVVDDVHGQRSPALPPLTARGLFVQNIQQHALHRRAGELTEGFKALNRCRDSRRRRAVFLRAR
jgi:hypothetical protein